MERLSPRVAAELAQEIYAVQVESELEIFLMRPEFASNSNAKRDLEASVGGHLIRSATDGFGVCAAGGPGYENDLFLMFRGSTSANNGADWVSNGKIGLGFTSAGRPVHLGFLNIFRSMTNDIEHFLSQQPGFTGTVHCIGHSLGGAVASLAAEWVRSTKNFPNVKLYTFGAPKPGMTIFSSAITSGVGSENIYRTYNATDPVPMIPLFPFVHPPHRDYGHFISSTESILSADAHDMELYKRKVDGLDWMDLKRMPPRFNSEDAIEEWLSSNIKADPNSSKTWEWLNEALIYILKKTLNFSLTITQSGIVGLVTLADKLAWILARAKDMVVGAWEGSKWVLRFIKRAMEALGMAVSVTFEDLTQTLIRNVIERLMRKTLEVARRAIQSISRS
ncbi:lipase family protein [Microbulbifer celer]|uniref:Lipase family protein n=1 Tax=Microbulbifer celer TaxID=435905 RepID=A0ABW3U7L2_9GAMM|nr:lipase family protein [Microbulbifer celer]UFN56763.1 lipase family protein [Microbulbifer celer]